VAFPLALGALTSLTGGGSLTPQSSSGPADSSAGPVNVGGIDFGPSSSDPIVMLAAVAVGVVLLVRLLR
jgi:hypothetical protein